MEKPTTDIDNRNKELGQKMQHCRKNAHVTQKEMAEFCGVSKNHLSKIEQGICKCPAHIFIDYGKKLNIPLNTMLEQTEVSSNIIPELLKTISQFNEEKQRALLTMVQTLAKE